LTQRNTDVVQLALILFTAVGYGKNRVRVSSLINRFLKNMPIQKFSNHNHRIPVSVKGKNTIRVLNALFSKGFKFSGDILVNVGFEGSTVKYSLPFKGPGTTQNDLINGLVFYQGGIVLAVPEGCNKVIFEVASERNFDYEFNLNFDFYPGGI